LPLHVCYERMYWASEIKWPVVRHTRDNKIKGCFERVRICALRGGGGRRV